MRNPKRRSLLLAGATLALAAVVLLAGSVLAQDGAETAQGWTVWQNGSKIIYQYGEGWRGEPTASGYQLRNAKNGVEHYYYGSFRVEHRPRDVR